MFLSKINKRILAITLLLFSSLIFARPEEMNPDRTYCFMQKHLSLNEAIALALRNNPQIRSATLQRVVDKFVLEVARNQFLPQYSFDTSATYSNGTKPFYSSNPQTTLETIYGTKIGLGLQDQVNAGRETAAVFEVIQPLLRGGGPQVTQVGYRTTLEEEVINRLNFKDRIMTTITNVVQAYYKLEQDHNNITIDEVSLLEANSLLRASQLRVKAGKLAATELVQQQARLANLKMAVTSDRNTLVQDYRALLILLGLDPRSRLIINDAITIYAHALPLPEEAIRIAMCNNIDYQRSLSKLKQLELALVAAKNAQRWKLDLIGRAQQQLIRNKQFAPVNINQIDAIGNAVPGEERTLVINLNIPIHDVNRKQELVRAKIALQQFQLEIETQKQQLIAAVLNSLQNLTSQLDKIKLAEEAVTYSKQSVVIANKKFLYGRTTMFEVTSLQQSLTLQQIGLITEKISYLNNETNFDKLLGVSLDKWCIRVIY
jgi:outer membrane protein